MLPSWLVALVLYCSGAVFSFLAYRKRYVKILEFVLASIVAALILCAAALVLCDPYSIVKDAVLAAAPALLIGAIYATGTSRSKALASLLLVIAGGAELALLATGH